MPDLSGMATTSRGIPFKDENADLEFATVFMRIPNQATPYEPRIPKIEQMRIITIFPNGESWSPAK